VPPLAGARFVMGFRCLGMTRGPNGKHVRAYLARGESVKGSVARDLVRLGPWWSYLVAASKDKSVDIAASSILQNARPTQAPAELANGKVHRRTLEFRITSMSFVLCVCKHTSSVKYQPTRWRCAK
jgi:hypothetical protein